MLTAIGRRAMPLSMSMLRLLIAVVVTAGCTAAPTLLERQQTITGGTADTKDPAVVLLISRGGRTMCSGTVLSPHVVLSAAHCVDPSAGMPSTVFIGDDNNDRTQASDRSLFRKVSAAHAHPKYNNNTPEAAYDIAVIVVAEPILVTPIAMNRQPIDNSFVGKQIRLVGFGTSRGNDSRGDTLGTKRQTSTKISDFDITSLTFMDVTHEICDGDSGGPALIDLGKGEVIVGVASYGDSDCVEYGIHTRVDRYASFIDPFVAQADPETVDGGIDISRSDGSANSSVGSTATGGDVLPLRSGCSISAGTGTGRPDRGEVLFFAIVVFLLAHKSLLRFRERATPPTGSSCDSGLHRV